MRIDRIPVLELAVAASVALHAGVVRVLPERAVPKPRPSALVEMVTLPPRAKAPEVAPPAPEPERAPTKRATVVAGHPLAGKTLTSNEPSAVAEAPAGDGTSPTEPLAIVPAPPAPEPAAKLEPKPEPAAKPVPKPATVEARDLARRPEPPPLAGALAQHYPAEARRRGVGGQAAVRARVDADGRVRVAQVSSESEPGFGAACQRTLLGSKWSPPLDREGRPVATWIRYTCRFRVGL